ncbi:MAG: hypothetical protein AAF734_10275 [Bacteroidota bacterium]
MITLKQITNIGFVFLMAIWACEQPSQAQEETLTVEGWETLSKEDYTIQYPDSLEIDQAGQMGVKFILFTSPISPQDQFRENINLVIEDLAGKNVDLDKYVEISESQVKSMITNGKLIDSERMTEEKAFHKLVYTGKQGLFDLKWQQRYWVQNEKAYILTLTCEESQYDEYRALGEKIMQTFEMK